MITLCGTGGNCQKDGGVWTQLAAGASGAETYAGAAGGAGGLESPNFAKNRGGGNQSAGYHGHAPAPGAGLQMGGVDGARSEVRRK